MDSIYSMHGAMRNAYIFEEKSKGKETTLEIQAKIGGKY
jgi:hypothetical protein